MNPLFILFALALVVAQFTLPRRLAVVPLLVAVCHFQAVPVVDVGLKFSVCKLVILAGLLRAAREGTLFALTRQPMDLWMLAWAGWLFLSGFAHNPKDHNPVTIRLSVIYDWGGTYLYARSLIKNQEDFRRFCRCLALVVLPLALVVLVEKATQRNLYAVLAGGLELAEVRQGRVRAVGPFGHAILLGAFAATSIPLIVSMRGEHPRWRFAGLVACALLVVASASSGPILALFAATASLLLWRWRDRIAMVRRLAILGLIGLHLAMQAPVWYLMARIDLAGGSTGWHRAELISAALDHLGEWWLVGTDYTRHWLAYGVGWSEYHVDMTNYYIFMGVMGGLLLMGCFLMILVKAFQSLGRGMRTMREVNAPGEFLLWCVGASLFAHCVTFFSISYFDQSLVALALVLGAVPGVSTGMDLTNGAARDAQGLHSPGCEQALVTGGCS